MNHIPKMLRFQDIALYCSSQFQKTSLFDPTTVNKNIPLLIVKEIIMPAMAPKLCKMIVKIFYAYLMKQEFAGVYLLVSLRINSQVNWGRNNKPNNKHPLKTKQIFNQINFIFYPHKYFFPQKLSVIQWNQAIWTGLCNIWWVTLLNWRISMWNRWFKLTIEERKAEVV